MANELSQIDALRVVIADDHPLYREGLARSLREGGIDVVGEAANGEAAIRAVQETAPDVVVMDLMMPGLSGLEATRRVTQLAPDTRVVVLTISAEEADMIDAILAGGSGYVLKDQPAEDVIAAIRSAAAGQSAISPRVATALLRRIRDLAGAGVDLSSVCLYSRELEVVELVPEEKPEVERGVAEEVVISASMVPDRSFVMRFQIAREPSAPESG